MRANDNKRDININGSKFFGFENSNQWIYYEQDEFKNIQKQFYKQ